MWWQALCAVKDGMLILIQVTSQLMRSDTFQPNTFGHRFGFPCRHCRRHWRRSTSNFRLCGKENEEFQGDDWNRLLKYKHLHFDIICSWNLLALRKIFLCLPQRSEDGTRYHEINMCQNAVNVCSLELKQDTFQYQSIKGVEWVFWLTTYSTTSNIQFKHR